MEMGQLWGRGRGGTVEKEDSGEGSLDAEEGPLLSSPTS